MEKEGSIHRRVKNAQMNLDWCDTYCYEVDHLACLASHKVGVSYKPILPGTTVHIIRTQLCSCVLLKCWEVITKMHNRAEQILQVALYVVLWSTLCFLCYDTTHFNTLDFTQLCIPVYCLWEDSLNFTQSIQKETTPTGRALLGGDELVCPTIIWGWWNDDHNRMTKITQSLFIINHHLLSIAVGIN